jgi:D-alanine-D-alanine ligase
MYFQCSRQICPAEIDDETRQRVADAALRSFRLAGCSGYARVDFRQGADGLPKFLEVNPNPDISPGYGAARQAEVSGMSYNQFIERIIQLAYAKVKV